MILEVVSRALALAICSAPTNIRGEIAIGFPQIHVAAVIYCFHHQMTDCTRSIFARYATVGKALTS